MSELLKYTYVIDTLLQDGRKIVALKMIRDMLGGDLADAKTIVDNWNGELLKTIFIFLDKEQSHE